MKAQITRHQRQTGSKKARRLFTAFFGHARFMLLFAADDAHAEAYFPKPRAGGHAGTTGFAASLMRKLSFSEDIRDYRQSQDMQQRHSK